MPNQPPRQPQRPQNYNGSRPAPQGYSAQQRPTAQGGQRLTAEQYADAMRRKGIAKRKAQEKKRRKYLRRRIIFAIIVLLILVGIGFAIKGIFFNKNTGSTSNSTPPTQGGVVTDKSSSMATEPPSTSTSQATPPAADTSAAEAFAVTTLSNANNPIPEGYVPELVAVDNVGYQFDKRASEALKKMLKDGNATGLQLMICSAYRSNERQTELFNEMKDDYVAKGMSEQEAYDKTKTIRAIPGTSEHETGLAADIVSVKAQVLDSSFDKTPEFAWLKENCAEYGFILRYPREKTSITGVIYEPWHYRYVGVEMAKEIMSQNVCFEEYVELSK